MQGQPESLIVHDGELEGIPEVLAELGCAVLERRGGPEPGDAERPCRLLVATARRMIELKAVAGEPPRPRPMSLAFLDGDSRSLRENLKDLDVDYLVRRPVHPMALRLLLRHLIYRGPERREARRMSVGHPIHYRAPLRRERALLTDLSMQGCGMIARRKLPPDKSVTLYLPSTLGVGRRLRLRGRVARVAPARGEGEDGAGWKVAVIFEELAPRQQRQLRTAVMIHACGPARLPELEPPPSEEPSVFADDPTQPRERRSEPRREFQRRVLALGGDASGVLVGSDLSRGGMRARPGLDLTVGDELRLALPLQPGEAPLLVEARVTRNDGSRGLLLQFQNLPDTAEAQIKRMLTYLPISACHPDPDADYAALVVSEILEHREA